MPKPAEPRQFTKSLGGGAVWIWGDLPTPVEGQNGPLVMGRDWMLEMIQFKPRGRVIGLFLAPFAIVESLGAPEFERPGLANFVGISIPGPPPGKWLLESLVVDLKKVSLADSPGDLLACFEKPLPHTRIEAAPQASALARATKRCIAETYREDLPLSEIARKLRVSHEHMTRQFKRDYGFTPLNYRHRLRVSEATGRLMQGDDILEVGNDVGFNDTSRFYHDFRKITGVSPGKCRP